MGGLVAAIKRLLGNNQEVIPPDEQLRHVEQNIKAITSTFDDKEVIILNEVVDAGGVLTGVEIRADRIHLQDHSTHKSKLIRLDESLDAYQELEEELRIQLAGKIARLVPDLAHSKQTLVLDHAVQVLKVIAGDQTERVRMMVAEELADLPDAPYEVVKQLAWDPSFKVAGSILEFSPLLRDDDLIEIISTSDVPGVAEAIAQRNGVSEAVSTAIVQTHEPVAIHKLLQNDTAHIDNQALSIIIDDAPEHEMWHEALVYRPELTQKTVNRIAKFVSNNLLMELQDNKNLRLVHKQDTQAAVHHRLNSWTAEQERAAELRVRQLFDMGRLDEERVSDFIHEVNEPYVICALAVLSRIPKETVKRIIRSESGRAITALAWEAGLSMRTAMALQMKIGRVHHAKMVNARGGKDYPIPEAEMQTYLEIFTG